MNSEKWSAGEPRFAHTWCVWFRELKPDSKDFYLLCAFEDPQMSERDVIARAIDTYRRRWAVEEVHRQVKQSMKWEGMRRKSYRGMKNLKGFMALAVYFIYKLQDYINILATGFPKQIFYKNSDRHEVKEFSYYRSSEVVGTCLMLIVQYRRKPNIREIRDRWQLKIRLD